MHTTLTIFTLTPGHTRWGLAQMGLGPRALRSVPGLRFFQLLGSGADGFGLWPNLRRYALLAVWESAEAAGHFRATHPLWAAYQARAAETWSAVLAPFKAQGRWDGVNPFDYAIAPPPPNPRVAVLTRASINVLKSASFWRFVRPTSAALAAAEGVRLAVGLGELPLVRQATFSVWESAEAMQRYAYHSPEHREAMLRTRRENWYSEELFARFYVLSSEGSVDGVTLAG